MDRLNYQEICTRADSWLIKEWENEINGSIWMSFLLFLSSTSINFSSACLLNCSDQTSWVFCCAIFNINDLWSFNIDSFCKLCLSQILCQSSILNWSCTRMAHSLIFDFLVSTVVVVIFCDCRCLILLLLVYPWALPSTFPSILATAWLLNSSSNEHSLLPFATVVTALVCLLCLLLRRLLLLFHFSPITVHINKLFIESLDFQLFN